MDFKRAERKNAKLRVAFTGASGSGKTTCALMLAKFFGQKIAGIDSEKGSMELVVGEQGIPDFDHMNLEDHSVQSYIDALGQAAEIGYDVVVVDSYSHSWMSALDAIDKSGGWTKGGKTISPLVTKLVNAIVNYPGHVICTIRSKMDYAIEKDEKTGKTGMKKLGLGPVARPDSEYEFTIVLDVTREGAITVSKSRCRALNEPVYDRNSDIPKIARVLKTWLESGASASPCDVFAERIRFASTAEAMGDVVKEIHAALQAGTVTKDDVAKLKPIIIVKKREIEGIEG